MGCHRPAFLLFGLLFFVSSFCPSFAPAFVWPQPTTVFAGPTSPSVTVRPVSSPREKGPGDIVTLLWELTNTGSEPVSLEPKAILPAAWGLPLPPGRVHLEPGESSVQMMVVLVGPRAAPGDYEVTVSYDRPDLDAHWQAPHARAVFSVFVPETRRVEAAFIDVPRYPLEGPYTVIVRVFNGGNSAETLVLSLMDDGGNVFPVSPPAVLLQPGASELVAARVAPGALSRRGGQRLRFTATPSDGRGPTVEATASVDISSDPAASKEGYTVFPLRLAVALETAGTGPSWRLTGTGRPSGRGLPELDLHIDGLRRTATLRDGTYELILGHQRITSSPLTGTAAGDDGFRALVKGHAAEGEFFALSGSVQETGRWSYGGRISFPLDDFTDVSLLHRTSGGRGNVGSLWSVRPRIRSGSGWQIEAEYALYGGSKSADHYNSGAARAVLDWRREATAARLQWSYADAGYKGRAERESRWSGWASLRLDNGLDLGFGAQRYRSGTEPGPDRRFDSARLHLAGGIPDGHWLVSFSQSEKSPVSDGLARRTELQLTLYRRLAGSRYVATSFQRVMDERAGRAEYKETVSIGWRTPVAGFFVAPYVSAGRIGGLDTSASGRSGPSPLSGVGLSDFALLGFGLRIDGSIGNPWRFHVAGDVDDSGRGGLRMRAGLRYSFDGGAALDVEGSARRAAGASAFTDFDGRITVTIPFDVPVARRGEYAALSGRVTDGRGDPVADVVLHMDGAAAVTDAEGNYRFAAATPGRRWLTIHPASVQPGVVFEPALPAVVDLKAGGHAVFNIRMDDTATVRGTVLGPAAGPTSVENGLERLPAEPLLIVLRRDDGAAGPIVDPAAGRGMEYAVERVVEPGKKEFVIDGLPPGRWRMTVRGDSLGRLYEVRGTPLFLDLQPGEGAEVFIEVRPVVRGITLLDGVPVNIETTAPEDEER